MSETNRHQNYDAVVKECFRRGLVPIAKLLFGITIHNPTVIIETMPVTMRREPDLLAIYDDDQGEKRILHIDFQATNDSEMLKRMYFYSAFIYDRYGIVPDQIVLYLDQSPTTMKTELIREPNYFSYRIISMNELSAEPFLAAEHPAAAILAILCKHENSDAVIDVIFQRLKNCGLDQSELEKYFNELIIFSQLRKLSLIVSERRKAMPLIIDITENALFQEGVHTGEVIGIQKGEVIGIQKGKKEGELNTWRISICNLFESVQSPEMIAQMLKLDLAFVRETLLNAGLINK